MILLEIQLKFRLPGRINTFSSTSFELKNYESQLALIGSRIKWVQCLNSLVKALVHLLCYRLKGNFFS